MKATDLLKISVVLAMLIGMASCSETDFAGGSAKKEVKPKKERTSGVDDDRDPRDRRPGRGGDDGDDGPRDDELGNSADGRLGNEGDTGEGGGGSRGDTGQTGDIALDAEQACIRKKADYYNVLLIFDKSGSQAQTDPNFVRRDGALVFIDQFLGFVKKYPETRVNIGVLAFNHLSVRIGDGWVKLKEELVPTIKDQINRATEKPEGLTSYSPVLGDAVNFFKAVETFQTNRKTKNFVVFITDGAPNAAFPVGSFRPNESMSDIQRAVDRLVNDHLVAFVAVAAGSDIDAKGHQVIREYLAKPVRGIKDEDHIGMYRRADNADELRDVLSGLINDVGACR